MPDCNSQGCSSARPADELGRRFEEHEPGDVKDARALRDIAAASARVARSERDLAAAVSAARAEGHTWAAIGAMLGTSGEAARQRYDSPPAYPGLMSEPQCPAGHLRRREHRHGAAGTSWVQEWYCDVPPPDVPFTVVRDEWNDDGTVRKILEIRFLSA